jgi:uncharacterized membrane protein
MNSVPGNFWEWVASLQSGERFGLMFFAMIAIVIFVITVFATIYRMHKNRLEDSLKRELLDRGMSASEIAMVVRARPGKDRAADAPTQSNSKG